MKWILCTTIYMRGNEKAEANASLAVLAKTLCGGGPLSAEWGGYNK